MKKTLRSVEQLAMAGIGQITGKDPIYNSKHHNAVKEIHQIESVERINEKA